MIDYFFFVVRETRLVTQACGESLAKIYILSFPHAFLFAVQKGASSRTIIMQYK